MVVPRSGEPDQPIRIQAAPGARVVISGTEPVQTNWTRHDIGYMGTYEGAVQVKATKGTGRRGRTGAGTTAYGEATSRRGSQPRRLTTDNRIVKDRAGRRHAARSVAKQTTEESPVPGLTARASGPGSPAPDVPGWRPPSQPSATGPRTRPRCAHTAWRAPGALYLHQAGLQGGRHLGMPLHGVSQGVVRRRDLLLDLLLLG